MQLKLLEIANKIRTKNLKFVIIYFEIRIRQSIKHKVKFVSHST